MSYWQTREGRRKAQLYDKSQEQINKQMVKYYKQAIKDIEVDMVDTYLTIIASGEDVLANELYKYNRYYDLRKSINSRLQELGADILNELSVNMENMYKYTSSQVLADIGYGTTKDVKPIIDSLWEAKGKYWSNNVWCGDGLTAETRLVKNMEKLQTTLEKGIKDCVARGDSKDKLVKKLTERFNVSFSEADRLARTELNYVQNQSTLDSYLKAGIEQYQYMAYIDNRTSEMCEEMNNQVFNLRDAMVGINYPPLHPNCRCSTKAIIQGVNYES